MPGPGGVDARPDDLAGLDEIAVREHVGRPGLRVARRGHAVREIHLIRPYLRAMHAVRGAEVRVDVDAARDDRLAGDVDARARRPGSVTLSARADGDDAVVANHDCRHAR